MMNNFFVVATQYANTGTAFLYDLQTKYSLNTEIVTVILLTAWLVL